MAKKRALTRIHPESRLAPQHRVFVNRNLRMSNIEAIGFDLDHTLAHYRGPAVEELAYRLASQRLVKRFGYSDELLEIPYDRDFVIRGLVIDKRRGNILKMDYHNYVSRGYHGLKHLKPEERKAAYGKGRIRIQTGSYVSVDTLFHLPEVYLYVALVNLLEQDAKKKLRSFSKVYDHVRQSIDSVHADGSLKRAILGNLKQFIRKDPRLPALLQEYVEVGKKLFLLTNSEYYYSDGILQYLFRNVGNGDRDWRELFDVIVVDAGKPAFFTDLDRPWVPDEELDSPCPVFHAGNARFLEDQLGYRGDQILYYGDHTYGDILRSKKTLGWRTAMVVEELREELEISQEVDPQLEELRHWKALRGVLESDYSALEVEKRKLMRKVEEAQTGGAGDGGRYRSRLSGLEGELKQLEGELTSVRQMTNDLGQAINDAYNEYWGAVFREGQEMSRFAHQVKDFACIYMTRVSNLLYYNINHYFRSATEKMPHEL